MSIIIQAVYFKFRFGLSYRDIEKLMAIRDVKADILNPFFMFRNHLE